ncbi:MAG: hypothetical protein Q9225_001598 [Loekoesia sp. 1 TL-2023]
MVFDISLKMVLRGSLLCCFYFAILVVAPLPPPASPGTDACGPFDHTGDAGFSTCTTSVVPGGPAPYGIVCGRDSNITIPIKIDRCGGVAANMCAMLIQGKLSAGEWHWTADNLRAPCRAGIYLSAEPSSAPLPNYKRCLDQIYQPMIMSCVNARYNVATVNIRQLPDYTTNFAGQAVNPRYPSFIISPMALYNSTSPVATPGVFGDPACGVDGVWDSSVNPNIGWDAYCAAQRAAAVRVSSGSSGGQASNPSSANTGAQGFAGA